MAAHPIPLPSWPLITRATLTLAALLATCLTPAPLSAEVTPAPEASLQFEYPQNGARFHAPAVVPMEVVAVDPDGDIRRVEFLVNGHSVGESVHHTRDAVIPGRPRRHVFEWEARTPGEYKLSAKATATDGSHVAADPIRVVVEKEGLPLVRIRATQPDTAEPAPHIRVRPGVFTISRSHSGLPLTVYLSYEGTAVPDVDYRHLPASVTLLERELEKDILVEPLDDEHLEDAESVVAHLTVTPTGGPPTYEIDPGHASARVLIHDTDEDGPARVEITHPESGMHFPEGHSIPIEAVAIDPAGYIPRLEFFAGEQRLGVSEITFVRAPDPGTPIHHTFEWKEPSPGTHQLRAHGTTASGHKVVSEPVEIVVGEPVAEQVVISLHAVKPETSEFDGAAPGLIEVRRVGGPLNVGVRVYYTMDGTARNGVDYHQLSGEVFLPENETKALIRIVPVPDKALEGPETVILRAVPPACPDVIPPPPYCYRVAGHAARITIVEEAGHHPTLPRVHVTHPSDGARFHRGEPFRVRVEAHQEETEIRWIELIINGEAVRRNEDNELTYHWENAPAGHHELRARAMDAQERVGESSPVRILVEEPREEPFVHRSLPSSYHPGHAFTVALEVVPPPGTSAYAVADFPPRGWDVAKISHHGAFDETHGAVKFGPFTDHEKRLLQYDLIPPAEATGPHEFSGTSSINGRELPVGGDRILGAHLHLHPADRNQDQSIDMTELTAYAAAWKNGTKWTGGPVPIPANFVTHAGLIWKQGERYKVVAELGTPPHHWVPVHAQPDPAPGDASELDAERQVEHITQNGAGQFRVRITLAPTENMTAYALEEKIPAGWKVANVSHEGVFDHRSNSLRWGLFADGELRQIEYTLTPPLEVATVGRLQGIVSADGHSAHTSGTADYLAAEGARQMQMEAVERTPEGLRLRIVGPAGQACFLETSSDLVDWEVEKSIFLPDGQVEILDDAAGEHRRRYYRIRIQP